MKAKKKRTKKYNPKKHRIGYLDMLDISANKGLSDRAAASIELDYRIHLQSFRTEPSHESWAYLVGLLLLADRLSYDLEEGEEFRREIEPALRQLASSLEKQAALEHKVAEDAPKVAFAETVEASYGDMLIREAAKTLGYPATLLFDWLRAHSWITMKNEPYADRVKQGVLRPRVSNFTHPEKGLSVSITAHVTPKGLYRLYQALLKEGKVTRNERLEQTAG